jgi:PE family
VKDMSYVITVPEMMATAATDLATIGSTLGAAHTQAAAPTLALMPAAADEVSAGVAQLFSQHAQDCHALAGKAAVFHEQFVHNLKIGAASYTSVEDAIVSLLNSLSASIATLSTTCNTLPICSALRYSDSSLLCLAFF